MSPDNNTQEPLAGTDEIVNDIERTREQLGETVDALAAKLDVKAQLKDTAEHAKANARESAGEVVVMARQTWPQIAVVVVTLGAAVVAWRRLS